MTCYTLTFSELLNGRPDLAEFIASSLTRPDSDFQRKLLRFLADKSLEARPADGSIAVVEHDGDPIGWARTEQWFDGGRDWPTLEAFVVPRWRGLGFATFAAAGLFAGRFRPSQHAVFRPSMLPLARRVGVPTVLFERDGNGGWRKA